MKHVHPRNLSRRRVQQILAEIKAIPNAGERIKHLSRSFLDFPYTINPLMGSAHAPEVFTASLDGFDCVTFMETMLALSLSETPDEFADYLRKIRYQSGIVHWRRRNHYLTFWIRNNIRAGLVRSILPPVRRVSKDRMLNMVPDLAPVRSRFSCIPKGLLPRIAERLRTGDLIFFASTRPHLDVFHCGILVRDGGRLLLRHASRSRKGVVEQELSEFLKNNRMAGVIFVRPAGRQKKRKAA
jgi:hypothetical protein